MDQQIDIDEIFRIVGKYVVEKELSVKALTVNIEQCNKRISEQQRTIERMENEADNAK